MEYYSVLNRFDARKRRISVFGRVSNINKDEMVITMIPCSKRDQFNKQTSHSLYRSLGNKNVELIANTISGKKTPVHHEIFKIKLENPATPKKEFLKFVNENYYRMREIKLPYNGTVVDVKGRGWLSKKTGWQYATIKFLTK